MPTKRNIGPTYQAMDTCILFGVSYLCAVGTFNNDRASGDTLALPKLGQATLWTAIQTNHTFLKFHIGLRARVFNYRNQLLVL